MIARTSLGIAALLAATMASAESPFEVQEIATDRRVVQADLADLDGDGLGDLVWTSIDGLPPRETRRLQIHYGREKGRFTAAPELELSLPRGIGAYDLADLDGKTGAEILLLAQHKLHVWSLFERAVDLREIAIPGNGSMAATTDERGMDRLRIARKNLGAPLRLVVPGFGRTHVLESNGKPVSLLSIGARANYFVPPRPGPIIGESEMEIFFDHPRLDPGDVDGDGRVDIIGTNRHELRVFRQNEDGGFAPSPPIALGLVSKEDHTRSSGSVRIAPHDFNGDGRADLMIANSRGSVFGGDTEISIHYNQNGGWKLQQPDQSFLVEGGLSTQQLLDLDGDGRVELLVVRVPTGVLEVVEILLTRAIDAEVSIYRSTDGKGFGSEPASSFKIGVDISFETFRLLGFVPTFGPDQNGDGRRDFLRSGDGDQIEIHLGTETLDYGRQHAVQTIDTGGRIRFGDLEGDGLADFVLYDPRRPGIPVRVGRNRGVLSRTP